MGIPLDEVEDLLPESAAYRQASRALLPKLNDVRGRPLTPLHGGHVGLLCTAGMLDGNPVKEKIVTLRTGAR